MTVKISKLIQILQEAQQLNGDLPLTTWDGFISDVRLTPAKDGVCYPLKKGSQTELGIEFSVLP